MHLVGDHDELSRQRCLNALADVEFFAGRFEEAAALYLEGGEGAPWQEAQAANVGLALAYNGRLEEARDVNRKFASASCTSTLAFHHYVAGEIDNLDGAWTSAEHHYRDALYLSDISGATFIRGVAAVGLASAQAAGGETRAAQRLRRFD